MVQKDSSSNLVDLFLWYVGQMNRRITSEWFVITNYSESPAKPEKSQVLSLHYIRFLIYLIRCNPSILSLGVSLLVIKVKKVPLIIQLQMSLSSYCSNKTELNQKKIFIQTLRRAVTSSLFYSWVSAVGSPTWLALLWVRCTFGLAASSVSYRFLYK